MAPIHAVPNFWDMPPVPQNQFPLYFAPFFAVLAVLGLALLSWTLPPILLLCSVGERSALALLRAYWTGRMIFSVLAVLSPLLFGGLTLLLYQLMARKLDLELRKQIRSAPLVLLPALLPVIGILMWAALAPNGTCSFCNQIAADIQQAEAGEAERMTVFIHEVSAPDSFFTDHPEGWQVVRRTAFGPDTGRSGIVLRFPEALEAALDPEGFAVESWDKAQWYEVSFTSRFRLVVQIVPVP